MLIYVAYALVIAHVLMGPLQSEPSPLPLALLLIAIAGVVGLHLLAGWKEWRADAAPTRHQHEDDGWLPVADIDDIAPDSAKVVCLPNAERIAIVRHNNTFSALSNRCAHQNGPLGEGRVIDGCLTCPWHGYQYRPHDGCSPPPYTEKIPTYPIRIEGRRILIHPEPNPAGTPVPPAHYPASPLHTSDTEPSP